MKWLPLVLVLASAGCGSPEDSAPAAPLTGVSSRWLSDANGRALVLRGVNASGSAKNDPLRSPNLADSDIDRIAKTWGMNFARYLVLWDALEPSPGMIDNAYIDRIATDVDRLGAAGIRVMLDMHQDVYATKFCCDGAPAWAIRDDGQPFVLQDIWSLNYTQPAATRAFDNFWDAAGKDADLQEHYASIWKALAKRFAGSTNLIGYDLINEPYPGSDFEAIEALTRVTPVGGGKSKTFDETKLGPFHQTMIDAIRTVDPDHWIFFEPRYAAPGNGSPSYLPHLNDPRAGAPRLVLAPHLYSSSAELNGAYILGDPTATLWEQQRGADIAAQGCPLLLGEWWAFSWAAPNATPFVEDLLAMTDRMGIGWAYWSYGAGAPGSSALFAPDGTDNPSADIVVRPYPRAIAGEPVSFSYDPSAKVLDLVFDQRLGISGATEIFVAASRVYPKGWEITVDSDPTGKWSTTFDAASGIASVLVDPGTTEHHVRLSPKL